MSRVLGQKGPSRRTELLDELDQLMVHPARLPPLALCGGAFASLGLLQQNAALLAASILFTPLAGVLLALAVSLIRADVNRVLQSVLILAGALASLLVAGALAAVIAHAAGLADATLAGSTILMLPAQPSLLTALAGVAAGGLAAYAPFQQRIPSFATDAAVSAVLLPSVCLVGIGAVLGHAALWHAALWQVVTNGSALVLAAAIVCLLMGYRPVPATPQDVERLPAPLARFVVRSRNRHLLLLLPVALVLLIALVHDTHGSTATLPAGQSGAGIQSTQTVGPIATATTGRLATPSRTVAGPTATLPVIGLTPVTHPSVIRAGMKAVVTGTHGLGANVRQAPGLTTILTVLPDGTSVTLTGKQAAKDGFTWLQVQLPGGKTGWVTDIFLQVQ